MTDRKTTTYAKTSEAVSIGHPDKMADQIADSIYDHLRTIKPDAQSAVEVACSADYVFIFGEIDGEIVDSPSERKVELANPELAETIRETALHRIREIGYTEEQYDPEILIDLIAQSVEINSAVEARGEKEAAAGDQGFVTGYAVAETDSMHALHYILAHHILRELEDARRSDDLFWLYPDAKSQVSVRYQRTGIGEIDVPVAIDNIVVSHAHSALIGLSEVREVLRGRTQQIARDFITENSSYKWDVDQLVASIDEAEILINPAGSWHQAGAAADSGLTGRKLVVDNYGSAASIGGGSSAGKCLNKVDRSGAYFARHIAKSIVSAGYAEEALVEIGFAIGVPYPTAVTIETYETETIPYDDLLEKVTSTFDFSVSNIIATSAAMSSFVKASEHGNYTDDAFPWEKPAELY